MDTPVASNTVMTMPISLSQLGWKAYFQQQLTLDEWEQFTIARVVAQQRSTIDLLTSQGKLTLPITSSMPVITVGDWLVLDDANKFDRLLDRLSVP